MLRTAAQWTALGSWLVLSGCNSTDVVAHGVVVSSSPADAASPSCEITAQLERAALPTGLANVFVDCQWPLRRSDNPDELGALLPESNEDEAPPRTRAECADHPYRFWQEPPRPEPAQRLLYCPKACEVVQKWIRCKLRDDVCNRDSAAGDGGPDDEPRAHGDADAARCSSAER